MEGRGDTAVEGGMVSADEEAVAKEKSVEEDKAVSQDEAVEEVKDKAAAAADTAPVFELWGPGPGLRRRFTLAGAGGAVVPRPTLASLAVVPLPTQIAGHGSENDGQRGLLVHESGFVLKPVQAPPKGLREVAFYRAITSSTHPEDRAMKELTATFYGTESVKVQNGVVGVSEYLVLENLTAGLALPCVMDVKMGRRTYGPDATREKARQEDAKYRGTKEPFGFSVLGIISHGPSGVERRTKAFGRGLGEATIHQVLEAFIRVEERDLADMVAQVFLDKLGEFSRFFGRQRRYHVYASSLLFVYDRAAVGRGRPALAATARLKLIDFAHVFPAEGRLDENFLFGLGNLEDMFRRFLARNS